VFSYTYDGYYGSYAYDMTLSQESSYGYVYGGDLELTETGFTLSESEVDYESVTCDYSDYTETGDVPCGGGYDEMDKWSFEVTDDMVGSPIAIFIDTVSTETASDPASVVMFVPAEGEDDDTAAPAESCYVASSDDGVECTFPPPSYSCPSMQFSPTEAGNYEIWVRSLGSCYDDSVPAEYSIVSSGLDDGALTLTGDGVADDDPSSCGGSSSSSGCRVDTSMSTEHVATFAYPDGEDPEETDVEEVP
jgi:hypothetical protein